MKTLENRIMKMTEDIKKIKRMMEDIINKYELDYGYVEEYSNFIELCVGSPNNSIISACFGISDFENMEDGEIIRHIKKKIAKNIYYFDADDQFEEIWSMEFGKNNNFRPSQFINMLIEDEEYFMNIYNQLI